MISIKTNHILFIAMILSASSLLSMQEQTQLHFLNKHKDSIWVLLKKDGVDFGDTQAIEPGEELTLSYDKQANMSFTALLTGPTILNFTEIPLNKNVENQNIKFQYNGHGMEIVNILATVLPDKNNTLELW